MITFARSSPTQACGHPQLLPLFVQTIDTAPAVTDSGRKIVGLQISFYGIANVATATMPDRETVDSLIGSLTRNRDRVWPPAPRPRWPFVFIVAGDVLGLVGLFLTAYWLGRGDQNQVFICAALGLVNVAMATWALRRLSRAYNAPAGSAARGTS